MINKKNHINNKQRNNPSETEEAKIKKQIDLIFKLLLILSLIINVVVITQSKVICGEIPNTKCGFSYVLYNSQIFFIFMWIENVLAIVLGLYNIIFGRFDKNIRKIIMGIIFILIQPIIWVNILIFLNISW